MAYIRLMEYAWSENPHEVNYYVPDTWEVTVHHIAGYRKVPLTPPQIATAVGSPIGSKTITELARGKKKVCILFDDMTRGTPTYKIIPPMLAELKAGGIKDDQIEFICALGAHQAWDRSVLARKVGADIIEKYPVYNHTTFMNCIPLGKTRLGTNVEVSAEVMSCDLRIAVSNIVPHPTYGFSGGGKIVMPGIASYESIYDHHHVVHQSLRKHLTKACDTKGVFDGNTQAIDAMEFARMAGIDFAINCMVNETADVVAIFAGDIAEAHAAAVTVAREHYKVPDTRDNDISIANAYFKANEAFIASWSAFLAVKRTGGTAVTIANTHLGQIAHYLNRVWGLSTGGRAMGAGINVPAWVNHNIFHSEFPEAREWQCWAPKDRAKTLQPSNWTEVISNLIEWHGFKAKVAVFPDGTIQYTPQPEHEEIIKALKDAARV